MDLEARLVDRRQRELAGVAGDAQHLTVESMARVAAELGPCRREGAQGEHGQDVWPQ